MSEQAEVDFSEIYKALRDIPDATRDARKTAMTRAADMIQSYVRLALVGKNPAMSHPNSRFTGSPADAITKHVSEKGWVLCVTDGGHARQNPIAHWFNLGTFISGERWTRGRKKQKKAAYRGQYPAKGPTNFFDQGISASAEMAQEEIINTLEEAISKHISE